MFSVACGPEKSGVDVPSGQENEILNKLETRFSFKEGNNFFVATDR